MTAYHGGKARHGKEIAEVMAKVIDYMEDNGHRYEGYWEAFLGMAGVYRHMVQYLPEDMYLLASDIHPSLILMWKALQKGWVPPKTVTKTMYERVKNQKGSSPEKAYIGFGHSFGGQYFSGFVGDYGMPLSTKKDKGLLNVSEKIRDVVFKRMSYDELKVKNWIIYCDPPYGGSSTNSKFYMDDGKAEVFDTEKFWEWARRISKNNLVFISDYEAPEDFVPIYTKLIESRRGGTKRREYLFIHRRFLTLFEKKRTKK